MLAFEDPRAKRKPPARTPRGADDHFGEKADFSASYIKPESDDVSENSFFGKSVKSRVSERQITEKEIRQYEQSDGENQIPHKKVAMATTGAQAGFDAVDEEDSLSMKHISAYRDYSRDSGLKPVMRHSECQTPAF